MIAEIDGRHIRSEADFHREIVIALGFSRYYGRNLDALWDVLTVDLLRPVSLVWTDSDLSKTDLGTRFDLIVNILLKAQQHDIAAGYENKFTLVLK